MALISQIVTADDAMRMTAQYVDIEHEYTINHIMLDIQRYASEGKTFFYYSRKWVNEWFWESINSYYCMNYFRRLGYQIIVEPNRYKDNDEIYMLRW